MRTAIPVDRQKFEQCVRDAEDKKTYSGLSALFEDVAVAYNALVTDNKIQPSVVRLRIQNWNISLKTQKGKRGRASKNPTPVIAPANNDGERGRASKNPTPVIAPANNDGEPAAPAAAPVAPAPVKKSIYDMPTRVDIEADQSVKACGCRCINIVAPAGDCPVKLNGLDQQTVWEWAEKTIQAGHTRGLHFAPSALRYFARQFYDLHGEDYQTVCGHIATFTYIKPIDDDEIKPQAPERMPVAIIPPPPAKKGKEKELEVGGVKLASVSLDDIEEESLD